MEAPVLKTRQIRNALETRRDTYPEQTICAVCSNVWMAHKGTLCPKGNVDDVAARIVPLVASGELPLEALHFQWRGTFFIPLIDKSESNILVAV